MTPTAEGNFAGRLVQRLRSRSCLSDAATGRVIGPEDLPRLIAAHGRTFLSAGLKKGDRVLIGCSLSPASALVYLGAIYAGLVAVPVEERAVSAFLGNLLEATGAKAVWTETGFQGGGFDHDSILLLHGDLAEDRPALMPPVAVSDSDLAALMATSGSTGVPRFVMISHGNLVANTEAIIRSQQLGVSGNNSESRKYFEQAIQLQPDYAAAWAGIADSIGQGGPSEAGVAAAREVMDRQEAAARKAVEIG